MKICSFNVNSIKMREDLIIKWLEKRGNDIDILCFQELKCTDEAFPFDTFRRLGYECEVFGQKAYNGVALCTKGPVDDLHKGLGESRWDDQKRMILGRYQGIQIVNLYAPHGDIRGTDKFFYKLDWYIELLSYFQSNSDPKQPIVVVGDLNVAREDRDVYDPVLFEDTIGTMPEERERFERFLQWGLIDAFRHLYPEARQFTWWDYVGGKIWTDEGMRIDYLLCTVGLLGSLSDVQVDLWPRKRRDPKPSDHAPVVGIFDI